MKYWSRIDQKLRSNFRLKQCSNRWRNHLFWSNWGQNYLQLSIASISSVELALLKPVCWVLCVALVFRLILLSFASLSLSKLAHFWQSATRVGSLLNVSFDLRRCPFYSNFWTKLVAVQRDPIHKEKTLTCSWNELIKQIGAPFELNKNVNLWLNFSLFS